MDQTQFSPHMENCFIQYLTVLFFTTVVIFQDFLKKKIGSVGQK